MSLLIPKQTATKTLLAIFALTISVAFLEHPTLATTITFDNAASGSNADLPLSYGSFVSGNATGFVTTDGTGATPNIELEWLGNIANELEYHTSDNWANADSPGNVHVVQFDFNRDSAYDDIAEVIFKPIDGRSVTINSFLLSGSTGQGATANYQWEVVATGTSGTEAVPVAGNTGTVNVGFTGDPGVSYTLRFSRLFGVDNKFGTALDDLSFSESLAPNAEVLRATVDRVSGNITISNVGANAADIIGYSLTSATGSLDSTMWSSLSQSDSSWFALPASSPNGELTEFQFGGAGDTIGTSGPTSTIDLGNAWIRSRVEDIQLEVTMTDNRVLRYSVDYVNGTPSANFEIGDLDFDGDLDELDWQAYNAGRGVDMSDESIASAYLIGDLDGDRDNDIADFFIFKSAYTAANGPAAFAALFAVPEPSSLLLLGAAFTVAVGLRSRKARGGSSAASRACVALLTLVGLVTSANLADATTITFATDPLPGNNADLPFDFGSNITGSASDTNNGFITDDGTGTTPSIELQWGPQLSNVLEFHSGPALTANFTAPILQFDIDLSLQTQLPPYPTIDFINTGDQVFKLNSFELGHATNQNPANAHAWTFNLVRLSDMAVVASQTTPVLGPGDKAGVNGVVTFDYIGDLGENYRLEFDGMGGRTVNTALDNVSFSEVPDGLKPRLKIVVNRSNGQIDLVNDSGQSFAIDSYEILSESGSLNPAGWNSLRNAGVGGSGDPNTGMGWAAAGGVDDEALIESYLLGSSTIADGTTGIDLGTAFNAGGAEDLKFRYHLAADAGFNSFGEVEYIGIASDADFNNDGNVDGTDFLTWQRGFNTPGATNAIGDTDGDMDVDGDDLAAWAGQYGSGSATPAALAVPEPASLGLLLLGGTMFTLRRKRQTVATPPILRTSSLIAILTIALILAGAGKNAYAAKTTDRDYRFGDNNASGTLDSQSQGSSDQQNLTGSPSPTFVSTTSRPGGPAGERGAQFDGVDDVLVGDLLNRPDETVSDNFIGDGPYLFPFPFNYDLVTARGLQLYVRPDASALGSGRQGIVFDTAVAGGISITADGKWTQSNDRLVNDGDIPATVSVVGNQWVHAMHHVYPSTAPGRPTLAPDSGATELGFTSVVYIDGVAVSLNNGNPTPGEADNGGRIGVLAIGAEEISSSNGFDPSFDNHFQGIVDDLEMYVFGKNENGFDYGTFTLLEDNGYIAGQIAAIPGGILKQGDITLDGNVDNADVAAMVAGWKSTKVLESSLSTFYVVGDWETYSWGDLNVDGVVNLDDAILLHEGLLAEGGNGLDFSLLFGKAVPEPNTFMLVILGSAALSSRRRRMR